MITHPYIRYAAALLMTKHRNIESVEQIEITHVVNEITNGLNHFSLVPAENYEGKDTVRYEYSSKKNNAGTYCFLAPNVVATEKTASGVIDSANKLISELKNKPHEYLYSCDKVKMSQMPISGEFASFSTTIGRKWSKATKLEQGLSIITTLTNMKGCVSVLLKVKDKPTYKNTCIIPDLPIDQMVVFIDTFNRLLMKKTSGLFLGRVETKTTKKKTTYTPKRPQIMHGNFPNAPFSVSLGNIALLGAIGEEAQIAEYSTSVKEMLEALKGTPIYLIEYGKAQVFFYSHYIIDIAKEGQLKNIVNSLYKSHLYNNNRRTWDNSEYQKFDMFSSRFLQLFNNPSFKDFLSFRAEYPSEIELLFKTYFSKMENIDIQIIKSARSLGSWLNYVAYKAAEQDTPKSTANYWDVLRQKKAKVLVELESSVFSSKSGDSLISQVITRAGRLVGMDAPNEAIPFMEKAASGELELDKAKNLLIAFSRVKSIAQTKETKAEGIETSENTDDYSEI